MCRPWWKAAGLILLLCSPALSPAPAGVTDSVGIQPHFCRGGSRHGFPCKGDVDCGGGGICTRLGHARKCRWRSYCAVATWKRCDDNFDCPGYQGPSYDYLDYCYWNEDARISCAEDSDCSYCVNGSRRGHGCSGDVDCPGSTCAVGAGECINGIEQGQYSGPYRSTGEKGDTYADRVAGMRTTEDDWSGEIDAYSNDAASSVYLSHDPTGSDPDRLWGSEPTRVTRRDSFNANNTAVDACIGVGSCNYSMQECGDDIPGDLATAGSRLRTCRTMTKTETHPVAVDYYSGRTVIGDRDRVLIYLSTKPLTGACADYVLGSSDMAGAELSTAGGRMSGAGAVALAIQRRCHGGTDNGRYCGVGGVSCAAGGTCPSGLAVADAGGSRVLYWADIGSIAANGAPPTYVLGQADASAVGCNAGGIAADRLCTPEGVVFDSAGELWVSDSGNRRILRFPRGFVSGSAADAVIGQADFVSNAAADSPTASSLGKPRQLAVVDSGAGTATRALLVADQANHRVLRYSCSGTDPITCPGSGAAADLVLGQPDFTQDIPGFASSDGSSCDRMTSPGGVAWDSSASTIWVADQNNYRYLGFTPPFSNGMGATCLLGQPHGDCATRHRRAAGRGFALAIGGNAAYGSTKLFLEDPGNNRVLVYGDPNAAWRYAEPDAIIGQPSADDYRVNGGAGVLGTNARGLHAPFDLGVSLSDPNGESLFVSDLGNHRVLQFLVSDTDGAGPSSIRVFGQATFSGRKANRESSASSDSLNVPKGIGIDPWGNLWVADSGNGRVLLYCRRPGSLPCGSSGTHICTPANSRDTAADLVLGKPDLTAAYSSADCADPTASTLCQPRDVAVDGSCRVYVVDFRPNRYCVGGAHDNAMNCEGGCPGGRCAANGGRVLIYNNSAPAALASGMPADTVLGIPDGSFSRYGNIADGRPRGVCSSRSSAAGAPCTYEAAKWNPAPSSTHRLTCVGGEKPYAECGSDSDCPGGTCGCPLAGKGPGPSPALSHPMNGVYCDWSTGLIGGYSIALAPSGRLYVNDGGGVTEFLPPFSTAMQAFRTFGTGLPHAFSTRDTSGYTPPNWNGAAGIAFSPEGDLIARQGAGSEGMAGFYRVYDPAAASPTPAPTETPNPARGTATPASPTASVGAAADPIPAAIQLPGAMKE